MSGYLNLLNANDLLSRRAFVSRVGKIMALGALSHFTLLGGVANAAGKGKDKKADECPGGALPDDICNPPSNPDKCPGEEPGEDYCPPNGKQPEDECDTGGTAADTCDPKLPKSDQCESGSEADDQCPHKGRPAEDTCPTGQAPEDYCPANGGIGAGDVCLGGGSTTNGKEQDTCIPPGGPSRGDQCSPGGTWWGGGHDKCKEAPETPPDTCTKWNDDTCYNGTNAGQGGNGGNDWCDPKGLTGSDQCNDGTPDQDLCTKTGFDYTGLYDTCPGGGTNVDTCEAGVSDDYCFGGLPDSDECEPPATDADECPGGQTNIDKCPNGEPPEDECTARGGCAGGDQVGTEDLIDDCTANTTPPDYCVNPYPDFPNPE